MRLIGDWNVQPAFPLDLGEDWLLVQRPLLPIVIE
jgi:hypothetical protein